MKSGAVIGVIFLIIIAGVLTGYIEVPEGLIAFFGGTTYVSYEQYEEYQANGEVPSNLRVDLRTLLEPWFAIIPGAELECESSGGEWHWDKNWVGCAGSGPAPAVCATVPAQLGIQQCQSVGAISRCDFNDVYCKY